MPATQSEPLSRSSTEFPAYNPERADEVQRRHELLAEFLRLRRADALLLRRASNISWLTCGAEVLRSGSCESTAAIFVTPDARVVLANNIDSPWLFDGPLCGLGFLVKERAWHESRSLLACDLCRGRKVLSDTPLPETESAETELAQFRTRLGALEEPLLRELGRDLAHAVEATCRHCVAGSSEAEIAGQVMHRLAHHQVAPVRVQVMSDGRGQRYRHWGFGDAPVRRYAIVAAVGRRNGLHAGVVRTVAFGDPPEELLRSHHHASLLLGTGVYFSQAGWSVAQVWQRLQRIFEKFGAPDEWRLADQGEICGYEPCEQLLTPDAGAKLQSGQPVFWHPSVGLAMTGETLLVQGEGQTCLTRSPQWPLLTVAIKGTEIELPGILARPAREDGPAE
jgi:hypothetical protein